MVLLLIYSFFVIRSPYESRNFLMALILTMPILLSVYHLWFPTIIVFNPFYFQSHSESRRWHVPRYNNGGAWCKLNYLIWPISISRTWQPRQPHILPPTLSSEDDNESEDDAEDSEDGVSTIAQQLKVFPQQARKNAWTLNTLNATLI